MKKRIPIQEILICDRCKGEGEKLKSGAFKFSGIEMELHNYGMGYDGSSGGYSYKQDLCGQCTDAFLSFMRKENQ